MIVNVLITALETHCVSSFFMKIVHNEQVLSSQMFHICLLGHMSIIVDFLDAAPFAWNVEYGEFAAELSSSTKLEHVPL